MKNKITLAIHGGAGTVIRAEMTAELENQYRAAMLSALQIGWRLLEDGAGAIDAVEAAVVELENFPLFNAGRGAVFTHNEKNEMDACLMDGKNGQAGAVASVRNVKNPIKLARLVLEKTEHILLAGIGANEFAREMNVEFEPDEYFFTDFRYEQLLNARKAGVVQLDHTNQEIKLIENSNVENFAAVDKSGDKDLEIKTKTSKNLGTVGAVACDKSGNVAAATSTGGMTNKKYGRIGDTPLVGAGTFADNRTCAVSCTGHGEFFMQTVAAYDLSCRMKYQGLNLAKAARATVEHLRKIGGEGGLIAVDGRGNFALPFNSPGMYRGFVTGNGEPVIDIYGE